MVNNIKEYRDKHKITQKELAQRIGVNRETIVRLENGRYNPSLRLAIKIEKYFGTTVDKLFYYEK